MDLLPATTGSSKKTLTVLLAHFSTTIVNVACCAAGSIGSKNHIAERYRVSIEGHVVESVSILAKVEGPKRFNVDASFLADDTEQDFPSWAAGVAHDAWVRWLTNQQVQLADIQTSLAIVFPSQLKRTEPVLVGGKGAVDLLVQIDEAALDHEEDQRGFW